MTLLIIINLVLKQYQPIPFCFNFLKAQILMQFKKVEGRRQFFSNIFSDSQEKKRKETTKKVSSQMEPGNRTFYETITYKWSSIKDCLSDLDVKIPAHLASKNENDTILFVIYPGRMKQVNNN